MQILHPQKDNGSSVFRLISQCPPLDLNSEYYYHLFCCDFGQTSVLIKENGETIGFLSAYLK
ncbi:MAG: diaminobutyrate acetyltransferase, partial [SAR324 cluster bacterium]|nr:diaminobutyrate acetyltransferase [SAR324 cluster bacterium]